MAKKITAVVKLQLPAGKATPGPPVGSTLGPHGSTSYALFFSISFAASKYLLPFFIVTPPFNLQP